MNRRKLWHMALCLTLSFFLLSGCNRENIEYPSPATTSEISAGHTAKETDTADMTETAESAANAEAEAAAEAESTEETEALAETSTKAVMETETIRETTMAAEDVTWLEEMLGKLFNKEPDEVTEDDYLAVTGLGVYIRNQEINSKYNNTSARTDDGKSVEYAFEQSEVPTSIDMNDIAKCKNISHLALTLGENLQTDTYIYHYEALAALQKLKTLRIELNEGFTHHTEYGIRTGDHISDMSFLEKMPDLYHLSLYNIDLPDDLSPLFSGKLEAIYLLGCGITENDFTDLGNHIFYPRILDLGHNEISDASIFTAMQKADGSQVQQLNLSNNPLTNLGDFLTYEEIDLQNPDTMLMDLYFNGTAFEEYSWYADKV